MEGKEGASWADVNRARKKEMKGKGKGKGVQTHASSDASCDVSPIAFIPAGLLIL